VIASIGSLLGSRSYWESTGRKVNTVCTGSAPVPRRSKGGMAARSRPCTTRALSDENDLRLLPRAHIHTAMRPQRATAMSCSIKAHMGKTAASGASHRVHRGAVVNDDTS